MKALITGASSGIGKDMAKYLSTYGYDLYVVARNKEKLINIYKDFPVKVTIIDLDLTKKDDCFKLYDQLKNENIDILINNAGFGEAGEFYNTSLSKEIDMIDLNIKAYHILTKLFLKDFVKRDYGHILNVASFAAFMPGVNMACYYATKSYVLNLSLAIYEELKQNKSKVKISVFCPGPIKTNFNSVAHVKFNVQSINSEYASKYAIDNMFKNKLMIIPPNMKFNYVLTKIMPVKLILKTSEKIQERKD